MWVISFNVFAILFPFTSIARNRVVKAPALHHVAVRPPWCAFRATGGTKSACCKMSSKPFTLSFLWCLRYVSSNTYHTIQLSFIGTLQLLLLLLRTACCCGSPQRLHPIGMNDGIHAKAKANMVHIFIVFFIFVKSACRSGEGCWRWFRDWLLCSIESLSWSLLCTSSS